MEKIKEIATRIVKLKLEETGEEKWYTSFCFEWQDYCVQWNTETWQISIQEWVEPTEFIY